MANFFEQFGPAAPAASPSPSLPREGGDTGAADNFFARFGPPSAVDVAGSIAAGQIVHGPAATPTPAPPHRGEGSESQSVIPGGEGMTFPSAPGPSATARRMSEGAGYGFGDRPLGINPEDRAKYSIARAAQPFVAPADFLLRSLAAGAYGGAGAIAGVTEDLGAAPSSADRLQRDLGIMAQFPGEPGMPASVVPPRIGPARVEPVAPVAPVPRPAPLPSLAVERPNTGVRLLPPEMPHAPAPRPSREDAAAMRDSLSGDVSARRSAGAAGTPGTGPLAEISPAAVDKLKAVFAEEGFTPHTLEQRLEEMSNHEYLGEISPNTALHMSALNGTGGAARNEITNSVKTRTREAAERMESAFDRAFGPTENRFQLQKVMEIERDKQVQPFWETFRNTTVEPTPQINALLPRLEAAGALQAANKAMAEEGLPSRMGFQRLGTGTYIRDTPQFVSTVPAVREEVPTAAAFQAAKEHLDDLIERNMESSGGANAVRRYTKLKNDLVEAIDKHPDPEVAGLWKRARDEYATPTSVIKAMKTGERALTGNITAEELPFLTSSYSPAELRAFNIGMRGRLEDIASRPGRTDNTVINTILARSNQSKIRWAIGDEKANELIAAIEHEQRMHNAPGNLIYNSMTHPRTEAAKFWQPGGGMLGDVTLGAIAHGVRHPVRTAVGLAGDKVLARRAERQAAEHAKMREEVSRIMTLQGPERDAVARELIAEPGSPKATGGRVVRAKGGRVKRADGGATEEAGKPSRNDRYVRGVPSTYQTDLGDWEPTFRAWVAQNKIPFDPDAKGPMDYDMRGFFHGLMRGDPRAVAAQDPNDARTHFPDTWKTPLHETFSAQSQYATPDAPQWNGGDQLVDQYSGRIVHDDKRANDRDRVSGFAKGGRIIAANVDPNPTEAQKEAGNYAKDHVSLHGLDIAIENPKGGRRSGMGRDGKPWSVKMPAHYGYIKGTVGRDKDHVDVYLGPHPKSPHVFVVDQVDAESKKFDEHKVMLGFGSRGAARRAYLAAFSDKKAHQRLGHMAEMPVAAFKQWLASGKTKDPIKAAPQAQKLPHQAVGYVERSHLAGKHCGTCSMFLPDRGAAGCTLVRAPISPAGWCRRFDAKKKD